MNNYENDKNTKALKNHFNDQYSRIHSISPKNISPNSNLITNANTNSKLYESEISFHKRKANQLELYTPHIYNN